MKCSICRRKINKMYKMTSMCKCGNYYCSLHKFDHKCSFDYKREQTKILKDNLVKIENNKGLNYIY